MALDKDSSRKDKKLEGKYANYFAVGYNANEFIFDFGQNYSETDEAELHTRIITNPAYMRNLLEVLSKSNEEYERTFGFINREV